MKDSINHNTALKPLPWRPAQMTGSDGGLGRPFIVYGIPNCDTTKKLLAYLTKNKIPFSFHDYKLEGISKEKLEQWCNLKGWELIFNKRSTTWRSLTEAAQKKISNQSAAIKLMMEQNSIIKRPIIEIDEKLIVGFNESAIKQLNN